MWCCFFFFIFYFIIWIISNKLESCLYFKKAYKKISDQNVLPKEKKRRNANTYWLSVRRAQFKLSITRLAEISRISGIHDYTYSLVSMTEPHPHPTQVFTLNFITWFSFCSFSVYQGTLLKYGRTSCRSLYPWNSVFRGLSLSSPYLVSLFIL